jgi:hypothetical protein
MKISLEKKLLDLHLMVSKSCDREKYKYLFIETKDGFLYTMSTDTIFTLFINHGIVDDELKVKIHYDDIKIINDYARNTFIDIEIENNTLKSGNLTYEIETYETPDFFKLIPHEKITNFNFNEYQISNRSMEIALKIRNKINKRCNMCFYPYRNGELSFVTFNTTDKIFGITTNYKNDEFPNNIIKKYIDI